MADAKPITLHAYESAYPGSMFERPDGGYIQRDDAESLAAGLLALIKSGDQAAEDAVTALAQVRADNKILLDALKDCRTSRAGYAITSSDQYPEVLEGMWKEVRRIDGVARAAIAKAKGAE